jgi:hypothetical protein
MPNWNYVTPKLVLVIYWKAQLLTVIVALGWNQRLEYCFKWYNET